jgi:hypothetical protein
MSRKYGQRGYMEGDRERGEPRREGSRSPAPAPPKHGLDRPRGRGLGAPTEPVFRCAVCGTVQPPPAADALAAACAKCAADLHTCTHCASFDTAARWECRRWEERAALGAGPVARKAKRNDCTLFAPRIALQQAQEKVDPSDPRAAFDALFDL